MASASTPTSTNQTLPFDIFLETLKYLDIPEPPCTYERDRFDKFASVTLGVLAVVCKDWQEPVEKIIYRRFMVKSERDFERLCMMAGKGDKRLGYIKIIEFNQQNPFNLHLFAPQFINLVEILIICDNNRWNEYTNFLRATQHQLKSLTFETEDDPAEWDDSPEEAEGPFDFDPSIADLDLPILTHLRCVSEFGPEDYATFFGSKIRPKLKALKLEQRFSVGQPISPVLNRLPNLGRLFYGIDLEESLLNFISKLNPSIKHLRLDDLEGPIAVDADYEDPPTLITLDCLEIDSIYEVDNYSDISLIPARQIIFHKLSLATLLSALELLEVGEPLFKKMTLGKFAEKAWELAEGVSERISEELERLGIELEWQADYQP